MGQQAHKFKSTLLAVLVLVLLLVDLPGAHAFARPKAGLLKLCPPGGESFATAWQITCGMRRRKKRDVESESYASKSNLLNTNSTHGRAKDSVQAIAGAALFNPEPLLKPNPVDSLPSSQSNIQKRSIWSNELLQFDPMANVAEQKMEAEKQEALYRAPSMTEMMMVCCRYGCSLRDLLPYCDPLWPVGFLVVI